MFLASVACPSQASRFAPGQLAGVCSCGALLLSHTCDESPRLGRWAYSEDFPVQPGHFGHGRFRTGVRRKRFRVRISREDNSMSAGLVVLDMDGVVTSERGYWDAAACTLVEILAELGVADAAASFREALQNPMTARERLPDSVITDVKNLSINTNWDLTFMA